MLGFVFQPNVRGDVKAGIYPESWGGWQRPPSDSGTNTSMVLYLIHIQMLGDADPYFYLDYKSETI